MWSPIKLDFSFYDFFTIYYDFFKDSTKINETFSSMALRNPYPTTWLLFKWDLVLLLVECFTGFVSLPWRLRLHLLLYAGRCPWIPFVGLLLVGRSILVLQLASVFGESEICPWCSTFGQCWCLPNWKADYNQNLGLATITSNFTLKYWTWVLVLWGMKVETNIIIPFSLLCLIWGFLFGLCKILCS